MKVVLFVALEIIRRTSLLLFPVIPGSCEKVFSILNVEKKDITLNNYQTIPSEPYSINESFPVFPRIDIDD
jgi:methionyl-tRNA synthetase